MKILFIVALLSLRLNSWAAEHDQPYQGSPEFERMKSLVGTWKGKADMGDGPMEFSVEYRLVAGGSVLEERLFAGTPKEMVTMYHDEHGRLALTHYCMLHNRPGMVMKSGDKQTLNFDFDPTCGLDEKSGSHMHALTIKFENADTIKQDWKLYENGKPKDSHPFTLKRVKA